MKITEDVESFETQRIAYFAMDKDFMRDVVKIRKDWNIPAEGFDDFDEYENWNKNYSENHIDYEKERSVLLKKHKISPKDGGSISSIILFGTDAYLSDVPVRIIKPEDKDDRIYLEITGLTRITDINEALWNEVEKYQAELPDYNKKIKRKTASKKFKRDMRILELKNKDFSNKEIASKVNDEYEGVISYQDVPTILANLKGKFTRG